MKIGVLSDTHTKVKKSQQNIDMLLSNGAEFLIHAGDIGEIDTLEQLKTAVYAMWQFMETMMLICTPFITSIISFKSHTILNLLILNLR